MVIVVYPGVLETTTEPWVDPVGETAVLVELPEVFPATQVVEVVYPGSMDAITVPLCEPDGATVLNTVVA